MEFPLGKGRVFPVIRFREVQLLYLALPQNLRRSKLVGNESDLRQMFDGLHLKKGVEESFSVAHYAVIRHQDGVMRWNEWYETGGNFVRSRGCEASKWNNSESHHRFLAEHFVECTAGTGERGGSGWMRVNDGRDVFSMLVDGKMHADLTGHSCRASELPPFKINDHHIRRPHKIFAHSCRRDEQSLVIEPDREVSRCARRKTKPCQPSTEPN